jgi:hypothetical protein
MHAARRIALATLTLFTLFFGVTSAASAATKPALTPVVLLDSTPAPTLYVTLPNGDTQDTYNTYEMYGWCYDEGSNTSYWGTCTNGYDGISQPYGGWVLGCEQEDCGQITVTGTGVSIDKRSDMHFVGGFYTYSYTLPGTNQNANISGSWRANQYLPFYQTITVGGRIIKLQLTSVTAYYNRENMPLQITPACNDTTNPCRGGGMK